MFAKLLAPLALAAVAAAECEPMDDITFMTSPPEGARSGNLCFFSDSECTTSTLASQITCRLTLARAKIDSPEFSYGADCEDNCFSTSGAGQVAASGFFALAVALVSQLF